MYRITHVAIETNATELWPKGPQKSRDTRLGSYIGNMWTVTNDQACIP
jgi:hypothetical protein